MTRIKKAAPAVLVFLLTLCVCFGFASCGSKDETPTYGYGEEGLYYYSASETEDYMLTLREGSFVLSMGTGCAGTYECIDGTVTFYEEGEEAGSGYATETGFGLTWEGRTYLFLTYEYYTVSFMDGSSTLSTQSVLNGKAASDPGDATKEGYVFLGWYADSSFTERYGFDTSITSDTTIYARFVEVEGTTEYKVTYDFGDGETMEAETLNGKIYDLPEAESSGQTFIGWWVSATNNADELTYRYEGETLCEDTTLFAVYASGSYIGASIKEGTLTWLSSPAGTLDIYVEDEEGNITYYSASSTSASQPLAAVSGMGKYTVEVTSGGVTETLTYVSNGLTRASGFTVISGNILMYSAVDNAERYYISIDCGTEGHDHSYIDNGTSLYYDFSSCEMPATGITFTVYAYAEGYYYSVSSYNYFLGLEKTEVTVEGSMISWTPVSYAMGYEVYIDGELVATTSDTSWSLSNYGTGTYEISVRPVTTGYYSEKSETVTFTKTTLASPEISGIDDYTITWTEVEGATGYTVSINGTETTISGGDITSLILSDENYTEGLDSYEISVKALAPDSANDSPYGETITVTGTSVGSAVSYENGTVTWQYSLSATEYRITVNDGDELIVTGTNNSPVTLTKSGNNEITIYFVNDYGEIYGTAEIIVYAYAIVFDARGGTAYDSEGNEIDVMYVAKGDAVTLPTAERGVVTADFVGWYTLPDIDVYPDKEFYEGDGYLFGDGTVFTGNSTIVLYAFWINQRLTVTLDPGMGTLTDENGDYITETIIAINGVDYAIPVPETEDRSYIFVGWYAGPDGSVAKYTDDKGNAYMTFSDETVTTLYAYWVKAFAFEMTEYEGRDAIAVSMGSGINLVDEVTVPETCLYDGEEHAVEIINDSAFFNCYNLKTLNIPDTIRYIDIVDNGYDAGSGAFESTALENVNVYATGEPSTTREITYYSEDGVLFRTNDATGDVELCYYPYGRTDPTYSIPETVSNENELELQGATEVPVTRYVNAIGGGVFSGHAELTYMTIPVYITEIGSNTFNGCTSLTDVRFECEIYELPYGMFSGCAAMTEFEIPSTVTEIGEAAFRECTALRSVIIPSSVDTIGAYAFYDCTSLTSAEIPVGVTEINQYTFCGCESMRGVELPATLTTIGRYAFQYCYSLYSVTIPANVESIGGWAFNVCSSLTYLTFMDGVGSVDQYAFRNCTSLVSVTIPSSVVLGSNAFYGCTSLESVTLCEGLTSIGDSAFNLCSSLSSVVVPSTLTSWDSAFSGCTGLESVVLSEGLTSIAANAFDGCSALTSVSIPSSLTYIGQYAFQDCTGLKSFSIPSTVTEIGSYAFYGCSNLSDVTLPEGLVTIGQQAFRACASITHITIPSTVTSIGTQAFYQCYKLVEVCDMSGLGIKAEDTDNGYVGYYALNVYTATEGSSRMTFTDGFEFVHDDDGNYYFVGYTGDDADITLPSSVDGHSYDVYDYAFYACTTVDSVTIPEGVTSIGLYAFQSSSVSSVALPSTLTSWDYAFYQDYSLVSVTLADGIASIGDYAFRNCDALESIVIPGSVRTIGENAFYRCLSLTSVTLNEGLETIGLNAFYQCDMRELTLPSTVTSIGNYGVYGNTNLASVTLNEGLVEIGNSAFYNSYSLTSITIPSTVTSIGTSAFYNCYKLVEVCNLSSLTITAGNNGNGYVGYYARNVYTATEGSSMLLNVDGFEFMSSESGSYILLGYTGSDADLIFPSGIDGHTYSVYQYAFYGNTLIKSVTIPSEVTSIGDYAFYGATELKSVTVGEGVTSIGQYAFYQCSALETVTLSEGLVSIGARAFYQCTSLTGITVPSTVTGIPTYCFYGCTALETATLLCSGSIGQYAFYQCTSLKELTLAEGLESIGQYAFYQCDFKELTIPSTVTSIDDRAFQACSSLTTLVLNEGLKTLGTYVFYNDSSLKSVVIPSTLTDIPNYTFRGCSDLETVIISEGVETIGNGCFYDCSSLKTIVIPSTLTSVGSNGFRSCSSLKKVYYLGTAEQWDGISINSSNNSYLTDARLYLYSEEFPVLDGDWWHWDENGEIAEW